MMGLPGKLQTEMGAPLLKPTRVRYGVYVLVLALAALSYLDRVCISMATPTIQAELRLNDLQMGWVFSAFTLAYALFEMPAGWMADRFGPRLMLSRIVIWWSIMTAATGWVTGFTSLILVRLMFGAGEAGTFPGIARVYSRWLPRPLHGRGFGLAVMAGVLGGAVGQPITAALLGVMQWRCIFVVYALLGLAWSATWYWWFRDEPHRHSRLNESELRTIGTAPPIRSGPIPWGAMIRSRSLLGLGGMCFGALYGWYFYLNWMPKYLLQARGFDIRAAGLLAALPLVCIALGVWLGGWGSDRLTARFGSRIGRRTPGVIGFPVASLALIGAVVSPNGLGAALLLAIAGGAAATAVAPAWAAVLEIGGRHAGVVSGAMNTFANLGGALSPLVIGFCLERWGAWDVPLLTVAAAYLVSAAFWLLVDPSEHLG